MEQERREVHVTGGKVNGRKELRVNVPKGKSITGMMTGRKDAGKKGTTEKAGGRKVNDQLDATRRSYSEAVIEGASRTERVFMGDSILRKTDKTLNKGEDVVVCLPGSRIEHVTERVGNVLGILPVMGGRGLAYRNCKRMAINVLVEQMCEEEGVGFVDLWGYFVGKEDMYMRDGLHLSGKGAAVFSENLLRSMDSGTGFSYLN